MPTLRAIESSTKQKEEEKPVSISLSFSKNINTIEALTICTESLVSVTKDWLKLARNNLEPLSFLAARCLDVLHNSGFRDISNNFGHSIFPLNAIILHSLTEVWHGAAIPSPEVRRVNTRLNYYEIIIGGTFAEEIFGERYGFGARLHLVHARRLVDPELTKSASLSSSKLLSFWGDRELREKQRGSRVLTWTSIAVPTERNPKRRVLSS